MAANPVLSDVRADKPEIVSMPAREEELVTWRQRLRKLVHKIFAGHEEFLGVTPD